MNNEEGSGDPIAGERNNSYSLLSNSVIRS